MAGTHAGRIRGPYRKRRNTLTYRVLEWVRKQPHYFITSDVVKALGLASARASAVLCDLRERGLVVRVDSGEGSGKWARWIDARKLGE